MGFGSALLASGEEEGTGPMIIGKRTEAGIVGTADGAWAMAAEGIGATGGVTCGAGVLAFPEGAGEAAAVVTDEASGGVGTGVDEGSCLMVTTAVE